MEKLNRNLQKKVQLLELETKIMDALSLRGKKSSASGQQVVSGDHNSETDAKKVSTHARTTDLVPPFFSSSSLLSKK
jgi:hypothetical protein